MSGSTDTPSKRQRNRPQRRALARQRAHGQDLLAWQHDRRIDAEKQRASLREKARAAAEKAGTTVRALFGRRHPAAEPPDRGLRSPLTSVPGRHSLLIQPTVVVAHDGPNHQQRRAMSRFTMPPPRPGLSRAMRRKQARRATTPASSTPYRSPARAAKLQRAGRLRSDRTGEL